MNFNIVFSDHLMPSQIVKSVFLAGPSPRNKETKDWRHDAISLFEKNGFTGTLFIPVPKERFYGKDDSPDWTYDNQVEWECKARNISDTILFWIPRDIKNGMPSFTTNIEFGEDLHSGKIVYGRPDNAEKCRYLDKRILEIKEHVFNDLNELIIYTLQKLGDGSLRQNGEVSVPLFIWKTEQFQLWYSQLKQNGNELIDVKILHYINLPNKILFSFTMWANIWVDSEQRFKSNEFVFSRKDISSILPYYKENDETFVILVKEFRSPVRNEKGIVYELPGGSSTKLNTNSLTDAQNELYEETGLHIDDINRFSFINTKQLCSTFSSHCCHLYKIELNKSEFDMVNKSVSEQKVFGVIKDTEIIKLEIVNIKNIMDYPVDYSTLGMILSGLSKKII